MKTAAVICEYNPFHLGHSHMLAAVRQQLGGDAAVVCLMSGNYVQRGGPALFPKQVRAEAALRCGADLVLELPVTRVLCSAEGFAEAAVLLDRLGCADVLAFGSECGDAGLLKTAAAFLDTPDCLQQLHEGLDRGLSWPAARQQALAAVGIDAACLSRPNDTLGVEYLRALARCGSAIRPLVLKREGEHDAPDGTGNAASAAAVRKTMAEGGRWQDMVPESVRDLYSGAVRHTEAAGERALLARLRALNDSEWETIPMAGEGLQYRLKKAARAAENYGQLLELAKTKRYPMARIRRMAMCAYLGLTAADLDRPVSYLRVLGFNRLGQQVLHHCKGDLPLCNAGALPPDRDFYRLECRCADLYSLFAEESGAFSCGSEQALRVLRPD